MFQTLLHFFTHRRRHVPSHHLYKVHDSKQFRTSRQFIPSVGAPRPKPSAFPGGAEGKKNTVRIGNREAVTIGEPGVQCSAVGAEKGWQLGANGTNKNRYNPLDQPFGDQPLHHPVWMTGSRFFKTTIGDGLLLYHITLANMEMSMINSK